MADGVVLDLYAEDLDKDFNAQNQVRKMWEWKTKWSNCFQYLQDDFVGDGVDLYDDIGGPPESVVPGTPGAGASIEGNASGVPGADGASGASNGVYHQGAGSLAPNHMGRRYQLYVGNLTWVNDFWLIIVGFRVNILSGTSYFSEIFIF